MSLSPEQYIALSAAAYGDYSNDDKNQKIDRIRKKIQNNELECSNFPTEKQTKKMPNMNAVDRKSVV